MTESAQVDVTYAHKRVIFAIGDRVLALGHSTQDSLPTAGQESPEGLFARKIPLKGFKAVLPGDRRRRHADNGFRLRQQLGTQPSVGGNQIVGVNGSATGYCRRWQAADTI